MNGYLGGSTAGAQEPAFDPFVYLHGQPLAVSGREVDRASVTLPRHLVDRVNQQTDVYLARARANLAPFGAGPNPLGALVGEERANLAQAEALRERGLVFLALERAAVTSILSGWMEGIAVQLVREVVAEKTGGSAETPRFGEGRARLGALRQRISGLVPKTPGAALAISNSCSTWQDADTMERTFVQQPLALLQLARVLEDLSGQKRSEEKPEDERFVRLLLGPLLSAGLRDDLERAGLMLDLSLAAQGAPGPAPRLDPASLHRLADGYEAAAQKATAVLEKRSTALAGTLAQRSAHGRWNTALGAIDQDMRLRALQVAPRGETVDAALCRLGMAQTAYAVVLATLVNLEWRTAPEPEPRLGELLDREQQRAQRALGQAQALTRRMPAALVISFLQALHYREGNAEEREDALTAFVSATVDAQLVAALAGPPSAPGPCRSVAGFIVCDPAPPALPRAPVDRMDPDAAPPSTPPVVAPPALPAPTEMPSKPEGGDPRPIIEACVEFLERTAAPVALRQARGTIEALEYAQMVTEAYIDTCLKVPTRDEAGQRAYFWKVLRSKVADWYNKHKREPLFDECPVAAPEPEEPAPERQISPIERLALCSLKPRDQQVLRARYRWNWTFAQIGERLGLSEDGARKAHGRALERLKLRCSQLRKQEGLPEDPEARLSVGPPVLALGTSLWRAPIGGGSGGKILVILNL